MKKKEEELIEKVCKENGIDPSMFKELIDIEIEYAHKNMARRSGIFKSLNLIIEKHL